MTTTKSREQRRPEIEGFEILEEIGRGGMGVVYRARQLNLDRNVALKVLIAAHHAGSEELGRFEAEARNLAGIQHAGIVQIYDVGVSDGLPFLSMEFVAGGSLAQQVAKQPLAIGAAAQLVRDLAMAIEAAHERGIIHRDLKPANVLMTAEGQPKITDFGIAKNLAAHESRTRTGDVMGTPGYMAPEQAGGVTKKLSPAADVYSLGAILYELLAGRPPFRGFDPVETLMAVLTEEPVTLRRLAPRVPRDLETICHKCLQKLPSQRYGSARDLAEELARFLDGRPILARRASPIERTWRWAKRRPAWASLIAVAALSLVSFIAFGTWKNRQLAGALSETQAALERSSENFRLFIGQAERRMQLQGDASANPLREDLLLLELIRNQTDSSATARWERALASDSAGMIHTQLNEPEKAEEAFHQAIDLLTGLIGQLPEKQRDLNIDLAHSESRLASHYVSQLRFEEAREFCQRAIQRLSQELARNRDDAQLMRALGVEYNNLAVLLSQIGEDPADAYQGSYDLRKQLVEKFPEPYAYRYDLALLQVNRAALSMRQGKFADAETMLRESLAALEDYVEQKGASEEARRVLVSCHLNLAHALASQERHEEADAAYQAAIDRLSTWIQRAPDSVALRLLLIDGLNNWFNYQLQRESWQGVRLRLLAIRDAYRSLTIDFPDNADYRAGLEKAEERLDVLSEMLKGDL